MRYMGKILGHIGILSAFAGLVFLASGCDVPVASCRDVVRWLAGRPTSAQIESKRIDILRKAEAQEHERLDSIANAEKAIADSTAVVESFAREGISLMHPSDKGGLEATSSGFSHRYYVVIGSFKSTVNADKLCEKISANAYVPVKLPFKNGFTAVAAASADNISEASAKLKRIQSESFCPGDVWILVNDRK